MPRPSISRLAALVLLGLSGCAAPRPPDAGIKLELSAEQARSRYRPAPHTRSSKAVGRWAGRAPWSPISTAGSADL